MPELTIFLALINTGLLTAIFFRLGSHGARIDALQHRIEKLEDVECSP